MKFLAKLAILVFSNALAIYVAAQIISGFHFEITLFNLVVAGALLGIVNSALRPLVKLLSFPLIILTLGLFAVIINMAMLLLVSYLLPFLQIETFGAAFWAMIVIGLVNWLVSILIKD